MLCIGTLIEHTIVSAQVLLYVSLVHNMAKTRDTMLKCKDRIDIYPCIADAPVDVSDRTCHKFIAEISCVIIV